MAALQNNSRAELQLHWYITISSLFAAAVPLEGQQVPNIWQESPSWQASPWLGVLLPRLQTHLAQPEYSSLVRAILEFASSSHVTRLLLGIQPMPRAAHSSGVVVVVFVVVVVAFLVVLHAALVVDIAWIARSHDDPWTVTGIHAITTMMIILAATNVEEKKTVFMIKK
jgi:hypothetical protein